MCAHWGTEASSQPSRVSSLVLQPCCTSETLPKLEAPSHLLEWHLLISPTAKNAWTCQTFTIKKQAGGWWKREIVSNSTGVMYTVVWHRGVEPLDTFRHDSQHNERASNGMSGTENPTTYSTVQEGDSVCWQSMLQHAMHVCNAHRGEPVVGRRRGSSIDKNVLQQPE